MKNYIVKTLLKTTENAAKSLLTSGIKKTAKDLLSLRNKKSEKSIEEEIVSSIGYMTDHYKVDQKTQKIVYKPSALFMYEFLNKSPEFAGKIIKDEENGTIYFGNKILNNSIKMEIISNFGRKTKLQSERLPTYFDQSLKLFDVSDFTSSQFKKHFSGWSIHNTSVIDTWIQNAFGSALETDSVYATKLFRSWIIGTAKRALEPGSSLDGCLTLVGASGVGKTLFFRELLPAPFDKRTGEIYCDIKSPQRFVENILGKTVACFDELSVLEHSNSLETFKQLLTSQFIDVRMAWARATRRYALRQGFGATSNKSKFIPDPFMSRRLWVIKVNDSQKLNFDFVRSQREMLWKEACYYALSGESYLLSYDDQKLLEDYNKQFLI